MTGNFDCGMIDNGSDNGREPLSVSEHFAAIPEPKEIILVEYFGHWFDENDFDWGYYHWLERQYDWD